jgi:hypothetical protein
VAREVQILTVVIQKGEPTMKKTDFSNTPAQKISLRKWREYLKNLDAYRRDGLLTEDRYAELVKKAHMFAPELEESTWLS